MTSPKTKASYIIYPFVNNLSIYNPNSIKKLTFITTMLKDYLIPSYNG